MVWLRGRPFASFHFAHSHRLPKLRPEKHADSKSEGGGSRPGLSQPVDKSGSDLTIHACACSGGPFVGDLVWGFEPLCRSYMPPNLKAKGKLKHCQVVSLSQLQKLSDHQPCQAAYASDAWRSQCWLAFPLSLSYWLIFFSGPFSRRSMKTRTLLGGRPNTRNSTGTPSHQNTSPSGHHQRPECRRTESFAQAIVFRMFSSILELNEVAFVYPNINEP